MQDETLDFIVDKEHMAYVMDVLDEVVMSYVEQNPDDDMFEQLTNLGYKHYEFGAHPIFLKVDKFSCFRILLHLKEISLTWFLLKGLL